MDEKTKQQRLDDIHAASELLIEALRGLGELPQYALTAIIGNPETDPEKTFVWGRHQGSSLGMLNLIGATCIMLQPADFQALLQQLSNSPMFAHLRVPVAQELKKANGNLVN